MREVGRLRAERFEHLDLRRAVGDMVLATDHMRDPEVDVVEYGRQEIQPAAVLAPDDGIAEQLRVEALLAADEVPPDDRRLMIEAEAPVRRAAFRDRRISRFALVDGGKSAPEQHLAAKLQLLRSLIAGID